MSIAALTYVWENSKQEGGSLLVMLALADYANDRGESYPAIKTLAKKARLEERQTQRVIRKLAETKEITVLSNAGPNGVNLYRINKGGVKMTGGGVAEDTRGVSPMTGEGVSPKTPNPSLEPSDNQEAFALSPGGPGKKQRRGTVNGSKPSQEMVEKFAVSLGLPKSDGTAMYWHFIDKSWKGVNNWEATVRKWQQFGYMPSQKHSKFNGPGRGITPGVSEPSGWQQWLASKPQYLSKCHGLPYTACPEYMRREFASERKAART